MTQAEVDGHSTASREDSIFWRYWAASAISNSGTAVTTVAMPLLAVLVLGASTFQVAVLAAATYLAWLVIGLPAGVIVARLPLRPAQVALDVLRAFAIASVPVAAALHVLTYAQLVVVALIVSFATVIFSVGSTTMLPFIVSSEQFIKRNSVNSASEAAVNLGGPSLGGLLVRLVGAAPSLLVDAVSYVLSAVLLQSLPVIDTRQAPNADQVRLPVREQIRDGWGYVMGDPVMRACTVVATLMCLTAGAVLALTPVFLVRTVHAPVGLIGLLMAADGAGSLIGAAVTTRLVARWGGVRVIGTATVCCALAAFLLPASSPQWGLVLFGIGSGLVGGGVTVFSIVTRTYRQATTPKELLSRVMATVRFLTWGAVPIGSLAAGLLGTLTSDRTALLAAAAPMLLTPLALWFSPVRGHRELA